MGIGESHRGLACDRQTAILLVPSYIREPSSSSSEYSEYSEYSVNMYCPYVNCCFLHCLEHAHKNFTHQGTCAVVM